MKLTILGRASVFLVLQAKGLQHIERGRAIDGGQRIPQENRSRRSTTTTGSTTHAVTHLIGQVSMP